MAKEQKEVVMEGKFVDQKEVMAEGESSILWGKVTVAQLTVLDKIIEGLEQGANVDHCLTLSNIYRNLCN